MMDMHLLCHRAISIMGIVKFGNNVVDVDVIEEEAC